MNTNPDDVRDRLERIAQQLAKLSFPTSPITVEDAHWLATCLEAYLKKAAPSVDAALGLVASRGGQRKQRRTELICEVWAATEGTLTAVQIAAEVHKRYPNTFQTEPDEKQIRRAIGNVPLNDLSKLTSEAITALGVEIARRLSADRT